MRDSRSRSCSRPWRSAGPAAGARRAAGCAARRGDQVVHVVVGQWGEAGGVVGQHLGRRAAEPEQHQGAEDVVLHHAREQLGAARGQRLDDDPGHESGEPGLEVPEGGAYLGVALEVEMDRVLFVLCGPGGSAGLHHHVVVGTAQPFGGDDGVVLGLGPGPWELRNAVAGEEFGAGARVEPATVRMRRGRSRRPCAPRPASTSTSSGIAPTGLFHQLHDGRRAPGPVPPRPVRRTRGRRRPPARATA